MVIRAWGVQIISVIQTSGRVQQKLQRREWWLLSLGKMPTPHQRNHSGMCFLIAPLAVSCFVGVTYVVHMPTILRSIRGKICRLVFCGHLAKGLSSAGNSKMWVCWEASPLKKLWLHVGWISGKVQKQPLLSPKTMWEWLGGICQSMGILGKYHSRDIHEWTGDDGKTHRCPLHPQHVWTWVFWHLIIWHLCISTVWEWQLIYRYLSHF